MDPQIAKEWLDWLEGDCDLENHTFHLRRDCNECLSRALLACTDLQPAPIR